MFMDVPVSVTRISLWDMLRTGPVPQPPSCLPVGGNVGRDTCVPYNSMPTLWRVVNDMDMVARVPFTPCTLFNGGAGDENHMLMTKGVIKVPHLTPSNRTNVSINPCWITVSSARGLGSLGMNYCFPRAIRQMNIVAFGPPILFPL